VIRSSILCLVGLACLYALLFGCSRELPPRSTLDLMQDREALDSVLTRCNSLGSAAKQDAECSKAREAVERLAKEEQKADAPVVQQEFERAREERRARDERERRTREAAQRVDPYSMPLVKDPEPATTADAQDPNTPKP